MTGTGPDPEHARKAVYAPADVRGALARARGSAFARDEQAPRTIKGTFRPLAWRDVAVQMPLAPPPAPVTLETDCDPDRIMEDNALHQESNLPEPIAEQTDTVSVPSLVKEATPAPPQEPAPPAIDEAMLQKIRDDAYAEGLSAGKAMTQSEREAELSAQFQLLEAIITGLGSDDLLDTKALSDNIYAAVLDLASQRVGLALIDMPELLTARIDGLLAQLAHLSGTRELFVAPEDLGLVQMGFQAGHASPLLQLRGDISLRRGDARLRIGGAEVSDLLSPSAVTKPNNTAGVSD